MALRAGEIRGHWRLTDQLLVPRPLTHLFLVALGFALAELAWRELSGDLLAYVAGLLGPFCLLCAGAVWGMRDKLDAVIDEDHMDVETFKRATEHAAAARGRFMWRAVRVTFCALLAVSPAVSKQLTGDMWHWMVLVGGVAAGDAAFSYLLANSWEDQIRSFRAARIVAKKRREEQTALELRILKSRVAPTENAGSWTHAPENTWQ